MISLFCDPNRVRRPCDACNYSPELLGIGSFLSCCPFAPSLLAAAARRPFLGEQYQSHGQTTLARALPSSQWSKTSIAIMLTCGSVYLAAAAAAAYAGASYRSRQSTQKIRFMLRDAVLVISDGVEAVLSSAADAPHPAAAFAIAICSASYAVAGVLGALKTWFGLKVIASSLLVERHGHAMCFLPTPGPAAAAARGERSPPRSGGLR